MTKAEKIWLFIGFAGLATLLLLEVNRVHKSIAAQQATFGGPQSTNPSVPGQVYGPVQGQDAIAAGIGPWYLFYNTPGGYNLLPPIVNTSMPPSMVSAANSNTPTTPNCEFCS